MPTHRTRATANKGPPDQREGQQANEGEGNRTAAREYNAATRK